MSAEESTAPSGGSSKYDLTRTISKYLDLHMMFPLLDFVVEAGMYPSDQVAQARLDLVDATNMVSHAPVCPLYIIREGDGVGRRPGTVFQLCTHVTYKPVSSRGFTWGRFARGLGDFGPRSEISVRIYPTTFGSQLLNSRKKRLFRSNVLYVLIPFKFCSHK